MSLEDTLSPADIQQVREEADLLHDEQTVEAALDRMAAAITGELADQNPLLLAVLVGGIVPAGKLVTRLEFPLQLDYVHATRYRGDVRGRSLHWLARPAQPLEKRAVLVVDDILDEGVTLAAILEHCRASGARSVYSAVLVDKAIGVRPGLQQADFRGLRVENRYVFGYGMDYRGYLRNAPGIYAVKGL
ncbi:MAG: hypoxanthine-guanine phosphoribosyltransferase [Gammaproteobacteria bacterium]|nr:hypoxanthine-guanine phosphoribosyltransferase [Gammaproteobacteria bacterium]MDJ0873321.1 hypoxanthine-guanine phosphoribosyltransferase [Gammaproteobacteria bacterium]